MSNICYCTFLFADVIFVLECQRHQLAFVGLDIENPIFDRAFNQKFVDHDRSLLANSMYSINSLVLNSWRPPLDDVSVSVNIDQYIITYSNQ
ncbi:hypothetical protein RRF57_011028 [Xylaria bambusicola]|uniref:Uncharacterized protein n=1 Tax=Xylaria bambusicola TaxID=326684 RepID=A0AAN7ZCV7_9PEZI